MTRIDNASPTNQRMLHNTEPKGSDTKGAVLPLNEDRAYPIPEASVPPERRPFLVELANSPSRLLPPTGGDERRVFAQPNCLGPRALQYPCRHAALKSATSLLQYL